MAQPPKYVRIADFSQDEANNVAGRSTVLTASLDAELDNVATSLNATIDNLGQIQRDDLRLKDKVVEPHTLSDAVKVVVGSAWNPRGAWASGTSYAVRDVVEYGGTSYVCAVAHTAGSSFSADEVAGYWMAVSTARLAGATAGNLPSITATGDLQDSGYSPLALKAGRKNLILNGTFVVNNSVPLIDAYLFGTGRSGWPTDYTAGTPTYGSDYVDLDGSSAFARSTHWAMKGLDFTHLSIRFRPNSVTGVQCLWKSGGATNGYGVWLDGSTLYVIVRDNGTLNTIATFSGIAVGKDYVLHVAGGNQRLRNITDGTVSHATGSFAAPAATGTDPESVGAVYSSSPYTGATYTNTFGEFFTGRIYEIIFRGTGGFMVGNTLPITHSLTDAWDLNQTQLSAGALYECPPRWPISNNHHFAVDITKTASATYLQQEIENVQLVAGQSIILSMDMFSLKGRPFLAEILYSIDEGNTYTSITSTPITPVAGATAPVSVGATVPAIEGAPRAERSKVLVRFDFAYPADGSDDLYAFTNVQLEVGSQKTEYERRTLQEEIALLAPKKPVTWHGGAYYNFTRVAPNFLATKAIAWAGIDTTTGNKSFRAPFGAKGVWMRVHMRPISDGAAASSDFAIRTYSGDATNRYTNRVDEARAKALTNGTVAGTVLANFSDIIYCPVQDDGYCYFDVVMSAGTRMEYNYAIIGYID